MILLFVRLSSGRVLSLCGFRSLLANYLVSRKLSQAPVPVAQLVHKGEPDEHIHEMLPRPGVYPNNSTYLSPVHSRVTKLSAHPLSRSLGPVVSVHDENHITVDAKLRVIGGQPAAMDCEAAYGL